MTTYAILLTGDETSWESADADERARMYGLHDEFSKACAEGGHTIVGGAELEPSSKTQVLRGVPGDFTVTNGPYAETVEQLGGFYLVESDSPKDLLELCAIISEGDPIEMRVCVPAPA